MSNRMSPSRSETSVQTKIMAETTDPRLHEQFTFEDIEELHEIFKNAPDEKFNSEEFRRLLSRYQIDLSDNDYNILFAKINTDRDMQHVGWDEFISYLILGYEGSDPSKREETLLDPITGSPGVTKSGHRQPIVCMDRIVYLMPDRSIKQEAGAYCTVSKEGIINFWSNDLAIQKTDVAKNPYFKTTQTWILSLVYMPDVRIICTSSTERDLRFYDTNPINFFLRIIINSLPWPVYSMHYHFPQSMDQTCKLILGDSSGNVRLIEFSPERRGPFESKLRTALIEVFWTDVIKRRLPQVEVHEYLNIHNDIVRQVGYSEHLNSILSIAECYESGKCAAMVANDLGVTKHVSKFYAPKGFSTFSLDDKHLTIATGGPDCMVRLWNPLVPQKPIAILPGHHSGIVYVFIQQDENKVYSIDHLKVIKVWAFNEQTLLQTYIGLQRLIPPEIPFVCCYNSNTHDLLIGSTKLISLKCTPRLRLDLIDGETHAGPVSVVLYNSLFKTAVSCGLDGFIIVWDPWSGKRLRLIKKTHMRNVDGNSRHVEITSACFDAYQQFLLTGARDGSLKVWNFNSGDCVRNLHLGVTSEVTAVFWIPDRNHNFNRRI